MTIMNQRPLLKWMLALSSLAMGLLTTSLAMGQDAAFKASGVSDSVSLSHWVAFYLLAGLTVLSALACITRRNPVVAAVWLVGTLGASAGIYLLLHATFMAAIQVLVYAGAIMVLFVFVIMAVERPAQEEIGLGRSLGTKLIGLVALALLSFRLLPVLWGPEVRQASVVAREFGTVNDLGRLLFTNYLFPFEAISILLLVAIVGAVVVTRRNRQGDA
jgi:NADH-quinone oxidoreductase subunit J